MSYNKPSPFVKPIDFYEMFHSFVDDIPPPIEEDKEWGIRDEDIEFELDQIGGILCEFEERPIPSTIAPIHQIPFSERSLTINYEASYFSLVGLRVPGDNVSLVLQGDFFFFA